MTAAGAVRNQEVRISIDRVLRMNGGQDPARLHALLDEQAALRRVATLVASGAPAASLFDRVCAELGAVLDVEATDMIRFEGEGAVVVGTWSSAGQPAFPVGERIPVDGQSVTAKLRASCRPERVDDYELVEGELAARIRGFGIRSVVGAPITVAGRLWGGIMVVSERPHAFPLDTEERIGNFAELVTAALANVEAREELDASRARIVEAADMARQRIERDLHDGAQQRLVSLALNLRMLQTNLDADSEAARELEAARSELDETLDELRDLARGIHPSVLTDRGLAAALSGLVSRSPVPVELNADGVDDLPAPTQTTAYFVVAEALTNALKHSRCNSVSVTVAKDNGFATVEVCDDGVGGTDARQGSGLSGLADRVSALGGTLEIESPVGQGTTIRARVPAATPAHR
jgi:signal transduction histidine kinase